METAYLDSGCERKGEHLSLHPSDSPSLMEVIEQEKRILARMVAGM